MASRELQQYILNCDRAYKWNSELKFFEGRPDMQGVDAYFGAAKIALIREKDKPFALMQSEKAKILLEALVLSVPSYSFSDIWDMDEYLFMQKQNALEMAKYYEILKFEGRYLLDSYCLYIEKNRNPKERFYLPRQKTLIKVANKLQALEDNKLDELFMHFPARTGKLIADDTPVLTSNGWKTHGDLVVGDYVASPCGNAVKVLALSEKNIADCLVTFSDGEQIQCHENHEWVVVDGKGTKIVETKEFFERKYRIAYSIWPLYVVSCERVEPKQGNCIQVEGGVYCVGKKMIPTHNSQMITMGTSWHCARDTEQSNLYVTYKEGLGGAYLDGVMEIYTDPTYCFADIFPEVTIAATDAKNHKIDLNRKKKYKTLSGKGLESGLNGEYDAKGWLILDDVLEGIQDVLNPDILHRKQLVFDNNVMSRKKESCKVIYNGTIWSLHDIYMNRLDFLENNPEAQDIRWEVLKIPALDPETDESNFDYKYGLGFTTKYYRGIRSKFEENDDTAGWMAQYQQEPIERDGAVFNPEHMHYYNGVLPEEEPYRICAVCDVALGGSDYLCFPIAYMYEDGSVYIHDVVFDNSEKNITKPQVVGAIIENNVGSAFFEANQGGEGYKDEVGMMLKEHGKKINLQSAYAPTSKRKQQRIWDKAPSIREYYFRDNGCRSPQYRKFMSNLFAFTINGKNKHDDAADAMATLAFFIEGSWSQAKVEAVINPFRNARSYYGGY